MSAESCPVHPNEQRKKNKKQRRRNYRKNQGKKGEKKSDKLESEIKQNESFLQSKKHMLLEEKTPDQARADQTPVCETSPAEGKLLTDDLRNEEPVTPKVTEKTAPPQVSELTVTPRITGKHLKEDPVKIEGPQAPENKTSGDGQNSYWWSETDEPSGENIENNIYETTTFKCAICYDSPNAEKRSFMHVW